MLLQIGRGPSRRALEAPPAPLTPIAQAHVFDTEYGPHLLVVDGSRIYAVDAATATALRAEQADSSPLLASLGLFDATRPAVSDEPPRAMAVRSLSLAVAQKCNLGCSYCYAQEGSFGAEPQNMERAVALASLELLFREAKAGEAVNIAFLGGEPLVNRALIRSSTELARERGRAAGVPVNFSITTNGTLLGDDDGAFFEEHGFAVTISLDGVGAIHDQQRPFRDGRGTYARIIENARPLLAMQRRMQVSARVTVTPDNLALPETLDELLALGFHSVGFSPMLRAPSGQGEMHSAALETMLAQMIACGEETIRRTRRGERYAFANLLTAVQEIHKGTHRPYPCGAGAGYFGVAADGDLYACHRFVNDADARFGDVHGGVDAPAQEAWLAQRHVHRQSPCAGCWARYLCGGGCHHEVIARGRPACDYIRGWLDYALSAYVRLRADAPELFA